MKRNHTRLAVFVALVSAALMGCGGGDGPQQVAPNPPIEAGAEADVQPDAQPEADPPDTNTPDADAQVPETGIDAEAGEDSQTCTAKLCDTCSTEGEKCGDLVCFEGQWNDGTDGGITSSACNNPEAGTDADSAAPDTDAGLPDADAAAEAEAAPPPEVCNGQDDNGNAVKDEGFQCIGGSTGKCQTACGTEGSIVCAMPSCTWGACVPPAEECNNGKDDDCDGKWDCNDPDCVNASNCQCNPPALGSDCGIPGEYSCSPAVRCNCNFLWDSSSQPHFSCINTETCNGQDDNGNGQADETFACVMNSTGQCPTGCGSIGTRLCSSSCQLGACTAPAENCTNGFDDDCDGKTDCSDPDCASFVACKPELCDGVDNNANGQTDEGYGCVYASSDSCVTACGSQGNKSCSTTTCTWSTCVPPAETCGNGKDDDCNGLSDCDDPVCKPLPACTPVTECTSGQTEACTTWCQSQGQKTCGQSGWWGACVPPAENCSNGADDNCDGLTDCNDAACINQPFCQSEVCDGVDNNANGQADEIFQCKLGDKSDCATSCGSTGKKTCQGPSCMWGSCAIPAEDCSNGVDDDCDGAPDCWDTDCLNVTGCQHNFGTCQAHTPTNQPYVCGAYTQDVMPDGMYQVKDGCANSLNDQWVVGGTWGEGRVRRLTGGNTWTNVNLPLTTKMVMGVTCQGANDVYVSAVESPNNGVFLRWNGSQLVRLAEAQTKGVEFGSTWASSANNVWIYGRTDYGLLDGAYIYLWDGNTMSRRKLPQLYAPMTFHASKVWGSGPNDVYLAGTTYDPNDRGNASKYHAGLMHYDGKSWGKVTIPSEVSFLLGIHGTSMCDVMAVGDKVINSESQGITLQRNGSSWTYKTYPNLTYVESVAKVGAFKYVLQGQQPDGAISHVWMGNDQGNFDVTWSKNFQYSASGSDFMKSAASWVVPGTSSIMTAGYGYHSNGDPSGVGTYAFVFRSTCQ